MHQIDEPTRQTLAAIAKEALALLNDVHECVAGSSRGQSTLVLGVLDKLERMEAAAASLRRQRPEPALSAAVAAVLPRKKSEVMEMLQDALEADWQAFVELVHLDCLGPENLKPCKDFYKAGYADGIDRTIRLTRAARQAAEGG